MLKHTTVSKVRKFFGLPHKLVELSTPRTDEMRVQNLPLVNELCRGRDLYTMEKLDGQSATFFFAANEKTGLFSRGLFGCCSRNIWYKTMSGASNWVTMAKDLHMEERLSTWSKGNGGRSIAIQGEIIGPRIQGNKYHRSNNEFYIFSVYDIDKQEYCNYAEKREIVYDLGLTLVPMDDAVVHDSLCDFVPRQWLALAKGASLIYEGAESIREGLVIRDRMDDSFSFKAINNQFLEKFSL